MRRRCAVGRLGFVLSTTLNSGLSCADYHCSEPCTGVPQLTRRLVVSGSGSSFDDPRIPYGPTLTLQVERSGDPRAALEPDTEYEVEVAASVSGRDGEVVRLDDDALRLLRFRTEPLQVLSVIVNLFNQQEVINVDDEYTKSVVLPIAHGKYEDRRKLRTVDGSPLVLKSNYGQPTEFQAPLMLRFGARLSC